MSYVIEARDDTRKAIITVGSRRGYTDSATPFSLDQITNAVATAHTHIEAEGKRPIPAIITPGRLIGRAAAGDYQEDVYKIDFACSPRLEPRMLLTEFQQ